MNSKILLLFLLLAAVPFFFLTAADDGHNHAPGEICPSTLTQKTVVDDGHNHKPGESCGADAKATGVVHEDHTNCTHGEHGVSSDSAVKHDHAAHEGECSGDHDAVADDGHNHKSGEICPSTLTQKAVIDDGHNHKPGEICPSTLGSPEAKVDNGISPEALKNYGVTFMALTAQNYTPYTVIPAKVDKMPGSELVFTMSLGGQIREILIRPGESIRPGQALIEILRDPIPRPELRFTGNFLQPEVKILRESASDYARSIRILNNLRNELKRLNAAQMETDAGSLIPKKDIIDASNQVTEQESVVNGIRHSLSAFGYSPAELEKLARGLFIVPNSKNWISALKNNGYWSVTAESLHRMLPETVRQHYWTVAGIGELEAMGLLSAEVLKAASESEPLRHGWTDAASLLIQGYSIHAIAQWADQGWLNPVVNVCLPSKMKDGGFDVESVTAQKGRHLNAGEEILTVVNHEQMVLSCAPLGSELKLLNNAVVEKAVLSAEPVVKGTGKLIDGLHIASFVSDKTNDNTALIPVENRLMKPHAANSRDPRVWQLREGMKYLLRIPLSSTLKNVFVVPNDAVTDFGSDKIVIVKHGAFYEVRSVVVLRQDGDKTVLSSESALKPGEEIAASGAFRLNLALQRGGPSAVDPHAGCSH